MSYQYRDDFVPIHKRALCKKLCKKCHEGNPRSKGWTKSKEEGWEKAGIVYCPGVSEQIRITKVPHKCRYSVEQLMKRQAATGKEKYIVKFAGYVEVEASSDEEAYDLANKCLNEELSLVPSITERIAPDGEVTFYT